MKECSAPRGGKKESVAWTDQSERLNVGPESAGARPGPACFGNGGTEATVTDADIVLRVLDPRTFQNGHMQLQPSLAAEAIQRLAERLGLGLYERLQVSIASSTPKWST